MRSRKPFALLFTILAFMSVCLAQAEPSPSEADKEQSKKEQNERVVQMLEQVISDAALLRLPQNKAMVFSLAGDLLWKFDEKRARELFRSAAGEIMAHNVEAERERRESTNPDMIGEMFDGNDPRQQVLPMVARRDAELALELLVQTRPAAIAEAMLKASAPDSSTGSNMFSFSIERQRVRQELELEQRFALLAADENPDRAIKLIKESLAKGISFNVLQLLQKLHRKDDKKAAELAGEVIRKFVDADLARRSDELMVAIGFLQNMAREAGTTASEPDSKARNFRFTDAQAKELANKLVNTFLQPSNSAAMSMAVTRAMPHLEKIVPDKMAILKQRQSENQRSLPSEIRNMQRLERVWDPNSTPEQILAEVPRMQNDMERMTAYQSVAGKIAQIDDEARARKLIDQIGDERAKTRALEQFEAARVSRTAAAGRVDDARKMIGTLTNKGTQIQKLVALAIQQQGKGTEADLESAKALMKQARSMINETPEDEDDLNNLMEVVRGYATVEPDAAFKLFEPIVDQLNDVVHASAILSKYNKRNRSFRKGELVLRVNSFPNDGILLFRYLNQIRLLAKADLARMGSLADRFQRGDARILVKLIAIQGSGADERREGSQGLSTVSSPVVF